MEPGVPESDKERINIEEVATTDKMFSPEYEQTTSRPLEDGNTAVQSSRALGIG